MSELITTQERVNQAISESLLATLCKDRKLMMDEPLKVLQFEKHTGAFAVDDKVRVTGTANLFYSWEGRISAVLNTDIILEPHRYQVRFLISNNAILLPPLLFKRDELSLVK